MKQYRLNQLDICQVEVGMRVRSNNTGNIGIIKNIDYRELYRGYEVYPKGIGSIRCMEHDEYHSPIIHIHFENRKSGPKESWSIHPICDMKDMIVLE